MANGHDQGLDNNPESRLSIHEVPEQISRIFFGKPDYNPSDSYNPGYSPGYSPGYGGGFYNGFGNDVELTIRLGQVALIAFIILVIFIVACLLIWCCLQFGGRQQETVGYYPQNVTQNTQEGTISYSQTTDWNEANETSSSSTSRSSPRARNKGLRRHKTGILNANQQESSAGEKLPKNKRSRLDVQINQPQGEMTIQDRPSSTEDNRSMPYYEVPNQQMVSTVSRPFASTSFVVSPSTPLPPIPSEQRSYSTINQTLSSRLV